MHRILVAGVLGGLAAMAWGGASWALLPFQAAKFTDIPNQATVAEVLRQTLPREGVYHYPAYPAPAEDPRAWAARRQAGPVVPVLVYKPAGVPAELASLLRELAVAIVAATIAAWLLSRAASSLHAYVSRVLFVASVGIIAALVTHGSDWNWGLFPAQYALVSGIDLVVEWLIVGLVLAWRVAPVRHGKTVELRARAAVA